MANEIDLVVGSEAFAQITKLLVELGKVDASFTELSAKFAALGSNTNTVKSTADLAKLTAENAKLTATIEQQTKEYAELNTKLKEGISLSQTKSKYTTQETTDLRLVNRELTLQNTKASELAGAYEKLSASHKIARENAANLAVIQGTNSKAFLEAAAAANTYDKRLKEIDQQLGNHGRHVGDYSRSWNGLGNSINQLTREAPAFANSIQTGFMALSNNIPILADEINNLKFRNQELAASGKPTESIFKQVASSFFSWQTLLSLGVTLLTIYGAKLWELATAGSAAEQAQKGLAEANAEAAKDASKEIGQLDLLYRTATDVSLSMEQRKRAVDKMQEVYPSYFKNIKDENILNGESKNTYLDLRDAIMASARAKAISAKLEESAAGRIGKENEINIELEKSRAELIKVQKSTSDNYDIMIGGGTAGMGTEIRVTKKQQLANIYSDIKKHNQALADLKNEGLKQDSFYLKEQEKYEKKSAKLTYDRTHIKAEKVTKPKEDKSAEEAAKKEGERLKREYDALLSNLQRQKEIDKDGLESFKGSIEDKTKLSIQLAQDEINIANVVFQEKKRLAKGDVDLITVANNEKKTSEENAKEENLKRVKKYYEDLNKETAEYYKKNPPLFVESPDSKKAREKEEADRKKSLEEQAAYLQSFADEFASKSGFPETFKMLSGQVEGFGKNWKVTFNAVAEASQEMFNMIAQSSMANYEQDYARLEAQKETSLKFAGDSVVAKEKIEEDYAKRKKEIDKKKFEDEKKISMVNIVIDTAQAVVATLAKGAGFFSSPLAIIVAAMGAAQLGMVAAQQFPAYAEGTDNHSGGLMLVNDGTGSNYQEKVVLPSGKVIRPQGRNVLMDAPKGTKVLNHEQQLFEMLQSNNISMSSPQYQGMTPDEMDEILGKHFSNIKTQNTIFDKNGFQSYVKNGNSITRSNSNRSQAIGISV